MDYRPDRCSTFLEHLSHTTGSRWIHHCIRRQWEPEFEHERNNYADPYDPKLILPETRRLVSKPELGALVIFNSRNFHEVLGTQGSTRRITLSSFAGRTKQGDILLWS
ncbi:unnamed protein product [Rotaria magnacalcarata]|uniref:Prolyl 4-hydroxylase alpha subunit Fe(2+) 2OG dioxygenase domain-containing protein n=1 Tax=Rotaria magnacalcarata TaxID=392030 RepID=A0A816D9C1_9BILA|nr:unnamed protein product [Rotaria magnacalcarata]CAF5102852.1 unnamed protein product [Rotaria magnacalcarata]CAF5192457.1 unnamed protein product [Rotaria magnacalcarata]